MNSLASLALLATLIGMIYTTPNCNGAFKEACKKHFFETYNFDPANNVCSTRQYKQENSCECQCNVQKDSIGGAFTTTCKRFCTAKLKCASFRVKKFTFYGCVCENCPEQQA